MQEIAYMMAGNRPDWPEAMSDQGHDLVTQHFQRLPGEGNPVLAARAEDASLGFVVSRAEDDDAQTVVDADPAVASGALQAELSPNRVALLRGRE